MQSRRTTQKRPFHSARDWALAGIAVAVAYVPVLSILADTYTLDPSVTGGTVSWNLGTTFSGGVVATGADNTADFSENLLTGPLSITLDGNQTIGNLVFGDTGNLYGTTVSAGSSGTLTLAVSSGSPTIAVTNGLTTISSGLSGTSGFTKVGSGTLTLTAANTFTGHTTIAEGTLQISSINSSATTAQSLGKDNSTITLGAGATQGTLEYIGAAAGTISRPFTLGGGGGTVKNSSTNRLTLSGAIAPAGTTLTFAGNGAITVSGVIGDATTNTNSKVVVNGAKVTLSGANTYGGTTAVFGGGTLLAGANGALPASTVLTLGEASGNTGGTLDLNNFAPTITGLTNRGTGSAIVTNSGSALKVLSITGSSTFGGIIQDGVGQINLAKTTGGTLTLTGVNTYSGGTFVKNGTILLAGGADNRILANSGIILGNGTTSTAKLQLGNAAGASNQSFSSLTVTAGTTGVSSIIGGSTNVSTLTINNPTADTYLGNLGGTGTNNNSLALTKAGVGTLTLAGNDTYTGGTSLLQGTLALGSANALPSGGALILSGGTLDLAGFSAAPGTVTLASGAIVNSGASATLSGSSFAVQSGSIGAVLAGSGTLTKSSSGTVTLGAANTYTGGTILNEGTLLLAAVGSLPVGGDLTITGGMVDVGGFAVAAGAVSLQGGAIVNSGAATTLSGSSYDLQSGTIALPLAGAGSPVTKTGSGSVYLAGVNSYTGDTTISAGLLSLNAASTGGGNITVADGGTLEVRASAAGQSLPISALSLGNTTGAALNLALGTFGNPTVPLLAANTLTLNGVTVLNVSGAGLSVGTFPLLSYSGGIQGAGFAGLSLGILPARVSASLVNDVADSLVDLKITAFDVPHWTGTLNGNWDIDDGSGTVGTLNFKLSGGTATGYYQGAVTGTDSVTFDDTAIGTRNINLTTTLTPIAITVDNSGAAYTFSGAGKISGATTLTKSGAGTLILANTGLNDYTGLTTINAGTLQVGDGITAGAGLLGGDVVLNGGTLLLNRPVGDDSNLANTVHGTGALVQGGGNVVTATGNNAAFSGTISVTSGALRLGNANATGSAVVHIGSAGTLDLAGYNLANSLQINGGTLKQTGIASTVSGPVAVSGAPVFVVNSGDTLRITGSVSGTGGFSKNGSGTLIVSGNNNYSGPVTVSTGTLQVGSATALGSVADATTVQSGATLDLAGFSSAESIVLAGGTLQSSTGTGGSISSAVLISGGGTVDVPAGSAFALSGGVNGSGGFVKTSGGLMELGGSNLLSGGISVNGGTLLLDSPQALPAVDSISLAAGTTLAFAFPLVQAHLAKAAVTANAVTIALGVDDANDLNFAGLTAASLGATGTVTYSGNLTPATDYLLGGGGGVLTVAANLTGGHNLTVGSTGAGTVVLTGANTFAGAVSVSTGSTLQLGVAGALGSAANTLAVNGVLDLNGFNATSGNLSGSGTITDNQAALGTSYLTDNIPSGTSTFSGSLADGLNGRILALVKDGAGTLVLNKANGNSYSGGTFLRAGTLDIRTNNAQVLPSFSNVTFTGNSTFLAANNGTGAGSLVLGTLTFQSGEGIFTSYKMSSGSAQTVALNAAPVRLPGATGNFVLQTATDPSLYRVTLSNPPDVTGQSLDGGIYFGGSNFATYDVAGTYLRPLNYATDANAIAVNGSQTTFGSVTGKDVQLAVGTGDITAQTSDTFRTLSLPGAGNVTLDTAAVLTISTGGILKSGGTATTIAGGAGLTTGGAGDLVVRTDQVGDILTISTPLSASTAGGLTKTGAGTLILTAANQYGGSTWINGGALRATDGVGLTSGPLVLNGGVFETSSNFNRPLGSGAGQVQVFGTGGFGAWGADTVVDLSGNGSGAAYSLVWGSQDFNPTSLALDGAAGTNSITIANGLILGDAARSLSVSAGSANLAGPITGTAGASLTKGGAGTLILTGPENIPGGLTATAGTLRPGSANVLANTAVTLNGGTLDLNGLDATVGALGGNGSGLVTDNSTGAGVTHLTEYTPSGSLFYSGSLADGSNKVLALVKDGPGIWILNKANGNTFTGGTTILNGVLDIRTNNASVLKSGSNINIAGNATFRAANNGTGAGALTLGQLTFSAGDGVVESNRMNTGATQTLTLAAAPVRLAGATGNFTLVTATDPTKFKVTITTAPVTGQSIDGGIFYNGADFAAYDNSGYLRALNYGTDSNATTVGLNGDQPTLGAVTGKDVQISGTGAITAQTTDTFRTLKISGSGALTLDSGSNATLTISSGGLLKSGGGAATIVSGSGIVAGGTGELVVRTDAVSDSLTIGTSIQAPAGLTKSGAGTLTLAAAESYTGPTTVNSGTLVVSGSLSGVAVVRSGATLASTGVLGDVTVNSGGTLALGGSGGPAQSGLLVGNLALNDGSTLSLNLGAQNGDFVNGNGTLSLSGTINLSLSLTAVPALGMEFSLFEGYSSLNFAPGAHFAWQGTVLNEGDVFTATTGSFTQQFEVSYDVAGGHAVELLAVPEPSALVSLLAGAAIGMGGFRRRRK